MVEHEIVAVRVAEERHVADPGVHGLPGEHDALGLELSPRRCDVVNVQGGMGVLLGCEVHAQAAGLPDGKAGLAEPHLKARVRVWTQPERVDVEAS